VISLGSFDSNSAIFYYLQGELGALQAFEASLTAILAECEKKCKHPSLQGPGLYL